MISILNLKLFSFDIFTHFSLFAFFTSWTFYKKTSKSKNQKQNYHSKNDKIYQLHKPPIKEPSKNIKLETIQANPIWNKTANIAFFLLLSSFFIAPIADMQGAENKLKTTNAYAEIFENPENITLEKMFFPPLTPAITDILDTTCSFATSPWIAETLTAQFHSPIIG